MNEEQYWGCFYIFPELYKDQYSPTVKIRGRGDIPALVDGVLTVDMVSIHLSYLKRTPILKDFVYIKLNLASLVSFNGDFSTCVILYVYFFLGSVPYKL